jgi:hypothetical protein
MQGWIKLPQQRREAQIHSQFSLRVFLFYFLIKFCRQAFGPPPKIAINAGLLAEAGGLVWTLPSLMLVH